MNDKKDFVIADIAVHLAASKNPRYRETIMAIYQTFACFLQQNGLVRVPLLPQGQTPRPAFKIMRSDLTEEGFEFIKRALHKWLKRVQTGASAASDSSPLAGELEKLRRAKKV